MHGIIRDVARIVVTSTVLTWIGYIIRYVAHDHRWECVDITAIATLCTCCHTEKVVALRANIKSVQVSRPRKVIILPLVGCYAIANRILVANKIARWVSLVRAITLALWARSHGTRDEWAYHSRSKSRLVNVLLCITLGNNIFARVIACTRRVKDTVLTAILFNVGIDGYRDQVTPRRWNWYGNPNNIIKNYLSLDCIGIVTLLSG